MKRIIAALAIVLTIILVAFSLQSCFVPYHDRDDRGDRREGPGDYGRDRRDGPPLPPHPMGPPMPPHPPGMPHP